MIYVLELVELFSSWLFWFTLLAFNLVAYGMFLVAYVFESRVIGVDLPIWRNQSKAYLPGDFGLSIVVAVGLNIRQNSTIQWTNTIWFLCLCFGIGLFSYFGARKFLYTPKHYTRIAWESPSKRYHDKVMFFGFCTTAVYICLPAYFFTNGHLFVKIFGLFGLVVWIGGIAYDIITKETPNKYQHPNECYLPIWKTFKKK